MSYLHSIFLTDDATPGSSPETSIETLPFLIKRNLESLMHFHPGGAHVLWTDQMIRDLLQKKFEKSIFEAYISLTPFAYKADLARYCILYTYGGIYSDLSLCFFSSLFEAMRVDPCSGGSSNEMLLLFRDAFGELPWITSNSLLYSPPGHRLFEACIELAVRNIINKSYGRTPLCPTGPNLLGLCLAGLDPCLYDSLTLGRVSRISEINQTYRSLAFLSPTGDLVAITCKDSKGLSSLGLPNKQDYNQLYHNRQCFGEPRFPIRLGHTSYLSNRWIKSPFCTNEDCLTISLGEDDILLFGPYISLDRAHYNISFIIHLENDSPLPEFELRVTSDFGNIILARQSLAVIRDPQSNSLTLLVAKKVYVAQLDNIEFLLCHNAKELANTSLSLEFYSLIVDLVDS